MKDELKQGNILIAEFMGDTLHEGMKEVESNAFGIGTKTLHSLQYHCSWNWIMTVVSKIKSLDKDYRLSTDNVLSLGIATPLDEVWKQVVKFIKHYNSKQP